MPFDFNQIMERGKTDLRLCSQIEGLGLTEKSRPETRGPIKVHPDVVGAVSATGRTFVRSATDKTPVLEVTVQLYHLGYNININSSPYEQRYHRHTPSPIPANQVVGQLESYLKELDAL
jgi:hypothetical protein